MDLQNIRIGIVGAGSNTQDRHIPGFQAIEGVKINGVCNRTRESSERIAQLFNIPNVYDNWLDLIDSNDIDAICIGTWPDMHYPITIASLENNKHVLTEARMALNADEARAMLEASKASPHLITQVVPAPMTLAIDKTIQELIANGYLGKPLAIGMSITQKTFADTESPIHWRQDVNISGYNALMMGIWYEILMRWVGPASRVMAMTKTVIPQRLDSNGILKTILIPDHIDILCELNCGAQAQMRFSAVTGLSPEAKIWIYGTDGTIMVKPNTNEIFGGRRGEEHLTAIDVPQSKQGKWRVETEFINAIRGLESVTLTTFDDGVRYMEFTEAVIRSAQTGRAIPLPF